MLDMLRVPKASVLAYLTISDPVFQSIPDLLGQDFFRIS
jgi:hypothetical protein